MTLNAIRGTSTQRSAAQDSTGAGFTLSLKIESSVPNIG